MTAWAMGCAGPQCTACHVVVPQHYFDKLPAPLDGEKVLLASEHGFPEQITATCVDPQMSALPTCVGALLSSRLVLWAFRS